MKHKCDGCKHKGEHQEMMFRPMGVCLREINLVEAVKNYEAEKCPYKKTNADRIRVMSDEELADFLTKESWKCDNYKVCRGCPRYIADCCLPLNEWLQQPAKGD